MTIRRRYCWMSGLGPYFKVSYRSTTRRGVYSDNRSSIHQCLVVFGRRPSLRRWDIQSPRRGHNIRYHGAKSDNHKLPRHSVDFSSSQSPAQQSWSRPYRPIPGFGRSRFRRITDRASLPSRSGIPLRIETGRSATFQLKCCVWFHYGRAYFCEFWIPFVVKLCKFKN